MSAHRYIRLAAGLAAAAFLISCASTTVHLQSAEAPQVPLAAEVLALAAPGPGQFTVQAGSMMGVRGCLVRYVVYTPAKPRSAAIAVLAHGFMRDLTRMRGWARLWASHGLQTAILKFCNSSLFAGNHDKNADDMKALAALLHAGPVIYAGFSAGGLSSLLAASSDHRAVGWLGLDPVDSGNLAAPAAGVLTVPALFLMGEPSRCNDQNNILPVIPTRRHVSSVRVLHTVHCSFEDPSDAACASFCGTVEPTDVAHDASLTIRAIATAWILERAGIVEEGDRLLAGLWAGGAEWKGRVRVLQAPGT